MASNSAGLLIGAVVIAVIGLGAFFTLRKKKDSAMVAIKKDVLTMKDVIEFFHNNEIMKELESNNDLIAVAIREKCNDNTIRIVLTLFNKKDSKITSPHLQAYLVNSIDADLESSFGQKDMMVLE